MEILHTTSSPLSAPVITIVYFKEKTMVKTKITTTAPDMYTILYDLHIKQSKILEPSNWTEDKVTGTFTRIDNYFPFTPQNYAYTTSYIYNAPTMDRAMIFQSIFPYPTTFGLSNIQLNISLQDDITHLRLNDRAGVFNNGLQNMYLVDDKKVYLLPVKTAIFINTCRDLKVKIIRSSIKPSNAQCFDNLTESETIQYIPLGVAKGLIDNINSSEPTEWVDASDYVYKGTLTYVETRDKEFHFVDSNRRAYRYNTDQIRPMLPVLVNGSVNGVFSYSPGGRGKKIKYVLIPFKDNKGAFCVCDSESSGSEDN